MGGMRKLHRRTGRAEYNVERLRPGSELTVQGDLPGT